jgi:hypothetical protein
VFAHIETLRIFMYYFYADKSNTLKFYYFYPKELSPNGLMPPSVPHWERGSTRIKRTFTAPEWHCLGASLCLLMRYVQMG